MTATGALDALNDCEKALQRALKATLKAAHEMSPNRASRARALVDHIEDAQALCARMTMYARADALTGNPHAFTGGIREWADYLIETGRIYQ